MFAEICLKILGVTHCAPNSVDWQIEMMSVMLLSDIVKKYTQAIPVNVVVYKSTPTFINSGAVLLFVAVCLSRKSDLPKK